MAKIHFLPCFIIFAYLPWNNSKSVYHRHALNKNSLLDMFQITTNIAAKVKHSLLTSKVINSVFLSYNICSVQLHYVPHLWRLSKFVPVWENMNIQNIVDTTFIEVATDTDTVTNSTQKCI